MLRLGLISSSEQSTEMRAAEMQQACVRLRGVELTFVAETTQSLGQVQFDRFDAAVIDIPIQQHKELTCQCARSGKHVLLYGPITTSVDDADQMIACCHDANVRLMMGGTFRFQPAMNAVKVALDSQRLGVPALLRSHSWRASETGMEGDAFIQLIAQIDLTAWIFDTLPTEIYALQHQDHTDTIQIHFGFPEGGMGLATISESLPTGDDYHSCTLIGSKGAAYADDQRQVQLLYQGESPRAKRTSEGILSWVEELREFSTAIEQIREPLVSGAAGRRTLLMWGAVQRSIQLGQPLRLEGGSYVPVN